MKQKEDGPSAIWGGGTVGLIVGLIMWLITGDSEKILWSVLVGMVIGIVLTVLVRLFE